MGEAVFYNTLNFLHIIRHLAARDLAAWDLAARGKMLPPPTRRACVTVKLL